MSKGEKTVHLLLSPASNLEHLSRRLTDSRNNTAEPYSAVLLNIPD